MFGEFVAELMAKKMVPSHAEQTLEAEKEQDKKEWLWEDKDFWEFVNLLLDQMCEDVEKQATAELCKKVWDK